MAMSNYQKERIKGASLRFVPVYWYRGTGPYTLCDHQHDTLEDAKTCVGDQVMTKGVMIVELYEKQVTRQVEAFEHKFYRKRQKEIGFSHYTQQLKSGHGLTLEQIITKSKGEKAGKGNADVR